MYLERVIQSGRYEKCCIVRCSKLYYAKGENHARYLHSNTLRLISEKPTPDNILNLADRTAVKYDVFKKHCVQLMGWRTDLALSTRRPSTKEMRLCEGSAIMTCIKLFRKWFCMIHNTPVGENTSYCRNEPTLPQTISKCMHFSSWRRCCR